MQWVIAAALICSSTVFTSCMNDDNDWEHLTCNHSFALLPNLSEFPTS